MKLKLVHTTIIRLTAPYNFDYSVHNPSHYPTQLNHWEPGKLWFSFRFKDKLLGIKFANQGTVPKPKIKAKSHSIFNYYDRSLSKKIYFFLCNEIFVFQYF